MKNLSALTLIFIWQVFFNHTDSKSQTINYVNNGSFEVSIPTVTLNDFDAAENWEALDSIQAAYIILSLDPPLESAPNSGYGFQFPRTGRNFIISQFYCTACQWAYPRNRLKTKLKANTTYCAKYYVVNTNNNLIAIENYAMYFGDENLDTIQYCNVPLTYINPAIEYNNGIITDTLNWTAISGTFVASGNEKYMVLGNFRGVNGTNTLIINSPTLAYMSNDVYIDDVSCINLNSPAFAGPDQAFKVGDSLYLGSPRDFAVDELCRWYQLPGNIALDTAAGIWVKPAETSTFVVRQEICGLVKWDTAVVFKDAVGLGEDNGSRKHFSVYPNPTASEFSVRSDQKDGEIDICIYDVLNRIVLQEKLTVKNHETKLKVELNNGIYLVSIRSDHRTLRSKQLIIQR